MTYDLKTSHLAKQDGAKQEDGIEKQQAQAQPPVQPPVVQVDTEHLGGEESVSRGRYRRPVGPNLWFRHL